MQFLNQETINYTQTETFVKQPRQEKFFFAGENIPFRWWQLKSNWFFSDIANAQLAVSGAFLRDNL